MPSLYIKRKKRSSSKKKKTFRKKRGMGTKNTPNLVRSGFSGFPQKMVMKHKYFETFDMTNTAGAPAYYSFYLNNMYDPNYTSTGHQPMYYDQMTALYDHYVVIGAKIKVTFQHAATTNTTQNIAIYQNDDGTIGPSYASLHEQSKGKWTTLATGQTNPRTLTMGWSAKKSFGGSILSNANLRGEVGSGPSETQFCSIGIFPSNLSSTQTTNCQVEIEYIAVWFELKDISGS